MTVVVPVKAQREKTKFVAEIVKFNSEKFENKGDENEGDEGKFTSHTQCKIHSHNF